MMTVSLHEFRLLPEQYLAATANCDVVLTQDGEPWVVLRSVEDHQDRLSAAYADSPGFQQILQHRRQEPGIPWKEAKERLAQSD